MKEIQAVATSNVDKKRDKTSVMIKTGPLETIYSHREEQDAEHARYYTNSEQGDLEIKSQRLHGFSA